MKPARDDRAGFSASGAARPAPQAQGRHSPSSCAYGNELSLDWYNRRPPAERELQAVGEVSADPVACIVRNEPDVPTMRLLRALVRMKQDGEFEAILAKYR